MFGAIATLSLLTGASVAEPLPGNQWPWTSVGRVLIDGDGPCSGVLVAPRTVLTAGHCVTGGDWRPRPTERISFTLETGTHAVASVRLAPRSPFGPDGKIEDLRYDWALLELKKSPAVAPVPYGGPAAARHAYILREPLVKAGWASREGGGHERTRDHVCRIQALHPNGTAVAFRCPGGAGTGRSGSALIQRTARGFEVVAVQSAITIRDDVQFGIAAVPSIDDRLP